MQKQITWKTTTARIAASVITIAALASLVTYETAKPMAARAAVAAPAAAPLDDNSVSALLSLDQAMETLAARVTPAIVNVAVTSRSQETAEQQLPDERRSNQQRHASCGLAHGGKKEPPFHRAVAI